MKKLILPLATFVGFYAMSARAQLPIDGAHYPIGLDGIKAGSLPDEGIYFRDDNYFYSGKANTPANFNTFIYAQLPRLSWITDWKILGANYGISLMIPIVNKQASYTIILPGFAGHPSLRFSENESQFGLGDIQIEPLLLSWHLKHFDFSASGSVWAPSGHYGNSALPPYFNVVNLGDGCWSPMLELGCTWYPDFEKSWAVSILNHFEFNSHIPGYRNNASFGGFPSITTPCNVSCSTYSLEWGISKTLYKETDLGIVGYY